MNKNYTNKDLIKAILKGGQDLNRAMNFIYREGGFKESVLSLILKKSGNIQDAEDVFQDGIRHLILNVRAGKFEQKSSLKTYLSAICRNLWLNQFNRKVKLESVKEASKSLPPTEPTPEGIFLMKERAEILQKVLGKLGEGCQKILGQWSLGFSFKEIGQKLGKSEGSVRKQKHDCFKKLMVLIKNRPDLVKELIEK